ncbi:helix-turn-helix transcriptional regulator [Natronorubrum halophilum]|uniref:helix-turn-helix transcriptional regulator n=1 Tax=Natronorubrum halophilum TaxID=1702106 RepID=UPI0010C221D7|nr:transcriptional regulator [Natronorubrum halophilum]
MCSSCPARDVLRTSIQRRAILECLDGGPRHKRDLVEALECSRSTIDRGMRELEQLELVRRRGGSDGRCQLTLLGRVVLSSCRRRVETVAAIDESSRVLEYVPSDAPMSTALLEGADVSEPSPHAPYEPLQQLVESIAVADRIRAVITAERTPMTRVQLYNRTVDGTLDIEAVFTEELATFLSETHPGQVRDVMVDGGFDIYVTDSAPYELMIIETGSESRVIVFVLNETGEVRGVITNETDAALEWATGVYRGFRADAQPLSPPVDD